MKHPMNWQSSGAWLGGTVSSITLSPDFITGQVALAATGAGLYRSTDGGQTWRLITSGLSDPSVLVVEFAHANRPGATCAFAASAGGRLFTTVDGGQSWREVVNWAGSGTATTLTISPNFAQDQTLFVATGEGIFRSQDGGQSWESSTFGLLDLEVLCLACAPDFAQSQVLWAGTAQGGLFRSRNAGRSWRESGQGLPDSAVQCLVASPHFAANQTLWLGTETAGLYQSTDGGANWATMGAELVEQSINCLAVADGDERLLAGTGAGVYTSANGGKSWHATASGEFLALDLTIAKDGSALAGAAGEGVYRSPISNINWQPATVGLAAHVPPLVVQSAHGELFALDHNGILAYSADNGHDWQTLNDGIKGLSVANMALAEQVDGWVLFAVAEGNLYKITRQDGAVIWEPYLPSRDGAPSISAVTPSPNFDADQTLALSDETGAVSLWCRASVQQSDPVPWLGETLLHVAFSPTYGDDQALCAISAQVDAQRHYQVQLWRSTNNGQSWGSEATLQTEIHSVALTWPADPHERALFLATRNRVIKLYTRSSDGQLTSAQTFLAETIRITGLAASLQYAQDHTIFIATNQGVYQSTDQGNTWSPLGAGLEDRAVVAIFPSRIDIPPTAVTLGGEVWQLR